MALAAASGEGSEQEGRWHQWRLQGKMLFEQWLEGDRGNDIESAGKCSRWRSF